MRDEPSAADLVETALGVLKERLVPQLPADCRYDALMVANAISIAARQMRAGEGPGETARARLVILYGDVAATLDDLERRLAADLRAGQFDPGATGRAAVFDHLWKTACAKAAESNPKALKGRT